MDNEVIHYRLWSTLSYSVYSAEICLMDTGTLLQSFQQEIQSWLTVFLLINSTSHIPVGAFAYCLQACYLPAQAKNHSGSPGIISQCSIRVFPQAGWQGSPGSSGLRLLLCQSLCKAFFLSALPQKLSHVPCLDPV